MNKSLSQHIEELEKETEKLHNLSTAGFWISRWNKDLQKYLKTIKYE
jgi:hypothetical protein